MTQIIVVTSGKGGVGKTTTSASLAAGLAKAGYKTVVIDFDIGLRNLDLVMGCERRVVYDIANVIHGDAKLSQALIQDRRVESLFILAASQTRDKTILTRKAVSAIIDELSAEFDYIVCDSPAGIEQGALMAMYFADIAIVVTNPEIASVRDSDRIIGLLHSKTRKSENKGERIKDYLVINRYSAQRASAGEMLCVDDIQELLSMDILGIVPESKAILTASNKGQPIILTSKSDAGKAYQLIVDRFLGTAQPYNAESKRSFWRTIFNRRAEGVL